MHSRCKINCILAVLNGPLLGIALSEVVSVIEEKIMCDNQTPVFYLRDLREMYQNRLRNLGASPDDVDKVNDTRLKEDLLQQIPGLYEQRNGKYIILTLDYEFGRALIECSQNTLKDDGIILSKAARIVYRFMFDKNEIFDGDLSKERQKSSVPGPLLHLVSNAESATVYLAQLLRFNSIKEKRHSKLNELSLPVKIGFMIHAKTRKKDL